MILEVDSDDTLTKDAVALIKTAYEESKNEKDIYALCFLKHDTKGNIVGKEFSMSKTTMFDLYFKQGENGEKPLVFFARQRKEYSHLLERNEKFGTEARMYHMMDLKYKMKCYNEPVIIGDYQEDGYTKNIDKIFRNNPYGYYEYFREMFDHDLKGILFKKRMYLIKHYILFSCLTKKKGMLKNVKGRLNKILVLILYIPGAIKTRIKFGAKKNNDKEV